MRAYNFHILAHSVYETIEKHILYVHINIYICFPFCYLLENKDSYATEQ